MKKIQYIILAMMTIMMASCMDGGYGDNEATPETAFGNNSITESNVVTIAQLCAMDNYKFVMTQYRDLKEVTDDIQLKVRVTGNDQGGNIYNKVSLQDENGDAILVCVYAGGMHSYLPVGQEILINLKGLYVGTYGYQKQIGVPYTTASGNTYPGRMPNFLWQEHFKLVPTTIPDKAIEPVELTPDMVKKKDWSLAGKLVKLTGVSFTEADGSTVWAPSGGNVAEEEANTDFSVERHIKGFNASCYINTSTSAKFANEIIPYGQHDVTAVLIRYSDYYQLSLRTLDDIK